MMKWFWRHALKPLIIFIWALPLTLAGLLLAIICRLCGAQWEFNQCHGTWSLSVWDALITNWLKRAPLGEIRAITIGHVIFCQDYAAYRDTQAHEHEHVKQYQRWGILFPLAYAVASLMVWWQGKHFYWDNRFEVAARSYDQAFQLTQQNQSSHSLWS